MPRKRIKFNDAAFRRALDALGMSGLGAARFLEVTDRSVRRWADGTYDVPPMLAMLLALMQETSSSPNQVRKLVGLPEVDVAADAQGRGRPRKRK